MSVLLDQPVNILPVAGVAVRVTVLLWLNWAVWLLQPLPQFIPAGELVTVPCPVFIIVTLSVFGVTVTVTESVAVPHWRV